MGWGVVVRCRSTGWGVVSIVPKIDPDENKNMFFLFAFELIQSTPESSWLNNVACKNIPSMLVTLETSHFEMSMLNDCAQRNISVIVVTVETSHFEISVLKEVL